MSERKWINLMLALSMGSNLGICIFFMFIDLPRWCPALWAIASSYNAYHAGKYVGWREEKEKR